MGQNTVKTPCSPHLLTVVSCNGARVQAEARVVGARGLRRGSRGHTPIPKPWGDMQAAPRADGLKYLCTARQGAEELRSTDKKTWLGRDRPKWHGTSGRYVCLCGRFRCFFCFFWFRNMYPRQPRPTGHCLCSMFFAAPCSIALAFFWTYRIISRGSLGHRPRT